MALSMTAYRFIALLPQNPYKVLQSNSLFDKEVVIYQRKLELGNFYPRTYNAVCIGF